MVVMLFVVLLLLLCCVVIGVASHVCLSVMFWLNHVMNHVMILPVLKVVLSSLLCM